MRIESCGQSFGNKNYISDQALQVMAKRMRAGEFVAKTDKFYREVKNYPFTIGIDTVGKFGRLKVTCFGEKDSCLIYKEGFFEALFRPKKIFKKLFRATDRMNRMWEKSNT